jgi:hypothetical protein
LDELLQPGDMYPIRDRWEPTTSVGAKARVFDNGYRRRIEQQQPTPDDPSGPGWRDVIGGEILQPGDMMLHDSVEWQATRGAGKPALSGLRYRRRIEQQQPSDSEPVADNDDDIERAVEELENNMTVTLLDAAQRRCRELDADLRTAYEQNAELSALVAEAERGGEQVNAELQQLREQVTTLTMERDHEARKAAVSHNLAEMSRRQVEDEAGKVEQLKERVQKLERELKAERDSGMTALRSQNRLGQEALAEALQAWLRPVLELVAEHPEDASPLAVAVLGFLPGIASRLIEE